VWTWLLQAALLQEALLRPVRRLSWLSVWMWPLLQEVVLQYLQQLQQLL
jgi:hypothetical protein